MNKQSFLDFGADKANFQIIDNELNTPEGLNADVLYDLWDVGVKFGRLDIEGIMFRHGELAIDLHDYRGKCSGGIAGLTVGKRRPSCLMEEGTYIIQLKDEAAVLWDRGLTVNEVQEIINDIDRLAEENGLFENGKRKILLNEVSEAKARFIVKKVFSRPDTVMPIFPPLDTQTILASFDEPELLKVVNDGVFDLICLKSEATSIIEEGKKRIKKLSEELGIDLKSIHDMSVEQIIELREKLDKIE